MLIRPLTTLEECRRVVELERVVWEYPSGEDLVSLPILVVTIKRGGLLLGAFDAAGALKGFAYSLAAVKAGRPTQWSHMLGVTADARGSGIGTRLKLAQREHAMRAGVELIEWTYDPLQSANAHLNFAKLGVVVREYVENVYGESSSPLHRGTPTDRFIVEWHLASPHVLSRISGAARPSFADAATTPVVNPSMRAGNWLAPGPAADHRDAPRVLVEIPARFRDMQECNPDLAFEWRMAARQIFRAYFERGYEAVDFCRSPDGSRGHYLLTQSLIPDNR